MKLMPFTPKRFRRRVFGQLWMLALQFLLGMLLNVIGVDATGTGHTVYMVVLWAHIINAIGLVEGGVYIALKEQSKLSWWAAVALGVTFISGMLMMFTDRDAWSFVMAIGFLVSTWFCAVLYVRADRSFQ